MKLSQLLYISKPVAPLQASELADLLSQARQKNRDLRITGLLLYSEESFMQVIEGPNLNIQRLYTSITLDSRHTDVQEIYFRSIEERHFHDWKLGFRYLRQRTEEDSLFETMVGQLADSIDQRQSIPNIRSLMQHYYNVPRHDVFEGWVET